MTVVVASLLAQLAMQLARLLWSIDVNTIRYIKLLISSLSVDGNYIKMFKN